MRWLDDITDSVDINVSKLQRWWRTGKPGMLLSMGSQKLRHDLATEQVFPWMHSTLQTSRPLPPHPFPPTSSLDGVICSFVFCSLERFPSFHLPSCWFGCTPQGLTHIPGSPSGLIPLVPPDQRAVSAESLLHFCWWLSLLLSSTFCRRSFFSPASPLRGSHAVRWHDCRGFQPWSWTQTSLPPCHLCRPPPQWPPASPPHSWPILPSTSLLGLPALPASQEQPPHRCPGPRFALSKAVPFRQSFRYVRGTGDLPAQLVGALQLHLDREVLGLSTECMPDGEPQRRVLGLRSVAPGGGSLGCRCTHRCWGQRTGPAGGRAFPLTGKVRAQTGRALTGRRIWKNWKRQSYK